MFFVGFACLFVSVATSKFIFSTRIVLTNARRREPLGDEVKKKFLESKKAIVVGFRGMTTEHVTYCHAAIDVLLSDEPIESPDMDLGLLTDAKHEEMPGPIESEPDEAPQYLVGDDLIFAADDQEPPYQRFWVGHMVRMVRRRLKPAEDDESELWDDDGEYWLRIWWRTATEEYGTYKFAYIPGTVRQKDEVWMEASNVICPVFGGLTSKNRMRRTKTAEAKQRYAIEHYFNPELSDEEAIEPGEYTRVTALQLVGSEVRRGGRDGTIAAILEPEDEGIEGDRGEDVIWVRITWNEPEEDEDVLLADVFDMLES